MVTLDDSGSAFLFVRFIAFDFFPKCVLCSILSTLNVLIEGSALFYTCVNVIRICLLERGLYRCVITLINTRLSTKYRFDFAQSLRFNLVRAAFVIANANSRIGEGPVNIILLFWFIEKSRAGIIFYFSQFLASNL